MYLKLTCLDLYIINKDSPGTLHLHLCCVKYNLALGGILTNSEVLMYLSQIYISMKLKKLLIK